MKQVIKQPVEPADIQQEKPASDGKRPVWKVFVFFIPSVSGGGLPKPPGGKGWLEIILLVLKVTAALLALGKAIGWAI